MQIKTINSGENAGTTYYVDDNGNFAGLAKHSNPAVTQEQITATHTQPEAIATFNAQPASTQNKVAPVVNPAYDASKDLDGDGALSLEEQGATSSNNTTQTNTNPSIKQGIYDYRIANGIDPTIDGMSLEGVNTVENNLTGTGAVGCLLYTSPSPRDS